MCKKGHGRIVGSFLERLDMANTYQVELLRLMAIHLLLLSVNKIHLMLKGKVESLRQSRGTE